MNILVVEDDAFVREALSSYLREIGHLVTEAKDGEDGFNAAVNDDYELVISDDCMPRMGGIELLNKIKKDFNRTMDVVLMTGNNDVALSRHDAINQGAFEYIRKPESPDELNDILNRVSEDIETRRENIVVQQQYRDVRNIHDAPDNEEEGASMLSGMEEPFIHSENLRKIFQTAEKLGSNMNVSVIVEGENGVGKELLAKYIHYNSYSKKSPFITIDCSTLPPELYDKELFGYESDVELSSSKGARKGKLELVDEGTIYFKNIDELPLEVQSRLFHVLKEKKFFRVDGSRDVIFKGRVVVCCKNSLAQAVEQGTFLADLYNQLNIGTLQLPPLRERMDEIIPLAKDFLDAAKAKYGEMLPLGFTQEAFEFMREYDWSGNVRELKNSIERIVLMEDSRYIFPEHFKFLAKDASMFGNQQVASYGGLRKNSKKRFQLPQEGIKLDIHVLDIIQQAYEMSDGNKTAAAQLLGISPWAFNRKFKKLDTD